MKNKFTNLSSFVHDSKFLIVLKIPPKIVLSDMKHACWCVVCCESNQVHENLNIIILIIIIIIINPCGSESLGWHLAGDSHVSWVGRTLKPWLATFLGEEKL